MRGRESAAAQRQRGRATEPRGTRHPWEGCCRVPAVLAGTHSIATTYDSSVLASILTILAGTFTISTT